MSDTYRIKPILGFENRYLVTNEGNVYSNLAKKWLKPQINTQGRLHVTLTGRKMKLVHRLVAENFLPNPTNLPQVNHKDGDPKNNKLTNLEWCTPSYNIKHAYKNGLMVLPRHEKRYNSKLTWLEIDSIRDLHGSRHLKQIEIARMFGVDPSHISRIVNNIFWKEEDKSNV